MFLRTKQEIPRTIDRFHIILKLTCRFLVMKIIKKGLEKVMESHGILTNRKRTNPVTNKASNSMLFIYSSCDRPRVIEALRGKSIVDIACGGSHSACITNTGELYTWGKGRYGRLGHGDSDDQLLPKLVEALRGQRVIDVACGSGDAQTLCLTDNDCVWSWGDGDYGKLGRGGSDGCKIPMKVEALMRAGVCKVECGSQFSVALTKSGAVYTWYVCVKCEFVVRSTG